MNLQIPKKVLKTYWKSEGLLPLTWRVVGSFYLQRYNYQITKLEDDFSLSAPQNVRLLLFPSPSVFISFRQLPTKMISTN